MSKEVKLSLPTDGSVPNAIKAARSAEKAPEYFVVLRYAGGQGSTLEVAGEGAGGWEEASKLLPEADGAYVFLRKDLKVEMAKTVKFVFVDWFPNGLKAMRRIALSALKKPVADMLKPWHIELSASDMKDVTQKIVDDRIGFASGTAVHTTSAAHAPASAAPAAAEAEQAKAPEPKKVVEKKVAPAISRPAGSSVSGGGGMKFTDQKAFEDAIKEIRNDKKDVNWVTASYPDRDTLSLTGSGTDGVTGLLGKLDDDLVSFGLLRVAEMIDAKSKTTKFVFIKSIPETVKPMKKAEITTRAGNIEKAFGQAHVSFDISKKTEITEQIVMDKLGNASGSKSNVKAK